MKRTFFAISILGGLIVFPFEEVALKDSFGNDSFENSKDPFFRFEHPELPPIGRVQRSILDEELTLPGEKENHQQLPESPTSRVILEPLYKIKFYPQLQAIAPVVKLNVRVGDRVKKGDLLIQLDPGKFQAFNLKTKAGLSKAEEEFRAKERLFQDGNASYFDYIESKSNLASAQAEVIFAEKNLEAVTFIAPFDGTVTSLNIEEYELPLENREMIELIHDTHLVGRALLPSNLIYQIKVNDPLEIYLDETKEKIQARISKIAGFIDPSSSTFQIEINVDNRDRRLLPGMSGTLLLHEHKNQNLNEQNREDKGP